ncbi:DUF1577 domain-containing protein, partial [Leptospira sp. 96542]|nr:DUF1577 domain-containing protein [Leptospira sp. 96542]
MRAMDQITGKEQKNHVILHYLLNQNIQGTWSNLEQTLKITHAVPNSDEIGIEFSEPWEVTVGSTVVLAKLLARYVELTCLITKVVSPTKAQCKVEKVSIAKKERNNPRYSISDEGIVSVTNIVSSKTIIEANMFNIPTLVRVNFEDYKKRLALRSGEPPMLDIFKSGMERKYDVVKSKQKILYIADYLNPNSYTMNEEGFINYEDEIDDQTESLIKLAKDKKIKSELILPILYTNELDEIIPIGYFALQTKENPITREDLEYYKLQLEEMVERIKDANLMKTVDKFPVLDLSTTGLRLKVSEGNLVETLPKQKGFLLELVFKLQTPFRFFAKVAWSKKDPNG